MKVPIPTTIQTCHSPNTEKLLSFEDTALNTAFQGPNTTYEPTSVLDLERSPSPTATGKPPSATATVGQQPDLDNLDGWDSILLELGLNEEFTPSSKLWSQISPSDDPHLPQFSDFPTSQPFDQHLINPPPINLPPPSDFNLCDFSYPNFGPLDQHHQSPQQNPNNNFDFIEDLIQAAQAFESSDSHHLHLLLSRLNHRLRGPSGANPPPLHRAAYYFKEALISVASGPTRPARLSSYEVVQSIRAHKSFSGVSPAPLFSTFAANQAILEAVDGAASVHAVDFDVGFGGHWASFLRELADRNPASPPPSVRITAVIPEEFGVESKLVKDNLTQFARDLNINFQIDFVLLQSFEILSFKSVKFMQHEKLAVHLSPAVLHRLGNGISRFVDDLRRVSPCTVVVVDREPGVDHGTASFSSTFVAGVEFYTGLLESLDVAAGGGGEGVRRIEAHVLRPRITAAVEAARGRRRVTWREAFAAAGMRTVGFSQFADYQAECLLRRAQVGGFHVAKRHGEMMLYWHDRPLVATSAWRCC